ncbi:MAG: baseplate assembly protein [Desulfobacterales bacterium]|nr:baseplate assembly protein [Desulfobacterales bacterium]
MEEFFGKCRGKVTNNVDPSQMGRVQVSAPSALGEGRLAWAMPCTPYAGDGVGFFTIPPVGANVWVEFEDGDLDHPIWSGCFWGSGEAPASPAAPAAPPMKVLKTDEATITIDDTPGAGGVTIEIGSGAKIEMTARGIVIDDGQGGAIKLEGPKVTINDGALEVI